MSTGSSPSCPASHCACEYMESPKQNCSPSSEPFLSYTQGLLQRGGREPYGSLPTFLYTPSILGSMLPQIFFIGQHSPSIPPIPPYPLISPLPPIPPCPLMSPIPLPISCCAETRASIAEMMLIVLMVKLEMDSHPFP